MLYGAGDIVIATAGRDSGRYFIVLAAIDEIYVHIADGRTRLVEKPKRKKIRHISSVNASSGIREKTRELIAQGGMTNNAAKKIIREAAEENGQKN